MGKKSGPRCTKKLIFHRCWCSSLNESTSFERSFELEQGEKKNFGWVAKLAGQFLFSPSGREQVKRGKGGIKRKGTEWRYGEKKLWRNLWFSSKPRELNFKVAIKQVAKNSTRERLRFEQTSPPSPSPSQISAFKRATVPFH